MTAPSHTSSRHGDAMWVLGVFIVFLIASAALLLRGGQLTLATGATLWTICFGGLLISSIRLCVIVVENVQAAFFQGPVALACTRCGYDMRGLGGAWRCPECGELFIDRAPSRNIPPHR